MDRLDLYIWLLFIWLALTVAGFAYVLLKISA